MISLAKILKPGDDLLIGSNGDDRLYGLRGNDSLYGNDGNDVLSGGAGRDFLYGNDGDDVLSGGAGKDFLYGGNGNDRLDGGKGTDYLDGGNGNDYLTSHAGYDTITGGLIGYAGHDTIIGGLGTDTLDASFSAPIHAVLSEDSGTIGDLSYSGIEEFQLSLSADTDYVDASALTSGIYMYTRAGDDTLIGSQGQDTLYADVYGPFGWGSNGNSVIGVDGGDIVRFLVSGEDRVLLDGSMIGNGDAVIDGATTVATGESFSTSSELVIISSKANFPTTLNDDGTQPTADSAAAAIGSASDSYAVGQTAVFVVNNGFSSAVWSFESADANGQVSASELTLVATLTDTKSTTAADYLFDL